MEPEDSGPPPPPETAALLSVPLPDVEPKAEPEPDAEAQRLKSLAEGKLQSSAFKSALKYAKRASRLAPNLEGVAQMVTALKVLRADPSDHYKVLRLPPFSPPATVRKQYRSLALALHPDKSSTARDNPAASIAEDAFKRVADSHRVLSDRSLKRDFDLSLRLSLAAAAEQIPEVPPATFWTACATCRLLHEFDRRYVGYRLVCPSCRKSFLAVEVPSEKKASAEENGIEGNGSSVRITRSRSSSRPRVPRFPSVSLDKKRKAEVSPPIGFNKAQKMPEETFTEAEMTPEQPRGEKTLAEMQIELMKKAKLKVKEKEKQKENEYAKGKIQSKQKEIGLVKVEKEDDLRLMAVEDSDFYDFDKDRMEKSFKSGQIWAIYDDDDGMPRHYGLINEVMCSNPFRVSMSWLDIQNNGNEEFPLLEKLGFHVSCGRFKVGRKVNIDSVNFFSHLVNCERAAKEVYRIYPKKGSVWALYRQKTSGEEKGRNYDILVCLSSYNETYGFSMASLEKVEGFKTIFKRQSIGCHAIKWLGKDDLKILSHQIPARKLSDAENVSLPKDCWELDPASLPAQLLTIDRNR